MGQLIAWEYNRIPVTEDPEEWAGTGIRKNKTDRKKKELFKTLTMQNTA